MVTRRKKSPRRIEVQQRLAQLGRVRIFHPGHGADPETDFERLCCTLAELGTVFRAFALYLSTRADLLSWAERRRLARVGEGDPRALAPALVRQAIAEELRGAADESAALLESLEETPFDVQLLFQRHYGRLSNGDEVIIRLVRPDRYDEDDLGLLPLLSDAVAPHLVDAHLFTQAIEDFQASFLAQTNGRTLGDALEFLRRDARDIEALHLPRVYGDLTTPRLLIVSRLPGRRLSGLISAHGPSLRCGTPDDSGTRRDPIGADSELARLLCEVWLRQAADGAMVPIDVRPENVVVLSSSEVGLDEGTFAVLPQDARRNLIEYLVAVAVDEPHKALECLLREFDGSRRRITAERLDGLFRQVVPEGVTGERSVVLFETVLTQWRLAMRNGYLPHHQTASILRGLTHLVETTRHLAPDRDPLLEGLKDFRVARLLNEVSTMLEPMYWLGRMDKIVGLFLTSPRVVDDALAAATSNQARPGRLAAGDARRAPHLPWLAAVVLLAADILARGEATRTAGGPLPEVVTAGIVLLVGGWLLKSIVAPDG